MDKNITNQDTGINYTLLGDYYLPDITPLDFVSKEPPKVFWKHYDLYRRGKITIEEYSGFSNISVFLLSIYLHNI